MMRAVFLRTLKHGVSLEDYLDAWVPENANELSNVRTSISVSNTNTQQVLTVMEIDATPEEYGELAPTLVKADAWERLDEIVESTEIETVFEEAYGPAKFGQA